MTRSQNGHAPPIAAPAPERGFTLLELLVAVTVFMLLAATAYAGLRTSAKSWERVQQRIDKMEVQRTVLEFIRTQVSQAAAIAVVQDGAWAVWFNGAEDRLVFLADLPAFIGQGGQGGFHEMALEVRRDGVRGDLVLRRQRLDLAAEPGAFESSEALERVLVEDVEDFELSYFGAVSARESPEWSDRWAASRRMPDLVQVRIVDRASGEWPVLLAPVRAGAVRFMRGAGDGRGAGEEEPLPEGEDPGEDEDKDAGDGEGDGDDPAPPSIPGIRSKSR